MSENNRRSLVGWCLFCALSLGALASEQDCKFSTLEHKELSAQIQTLEHVKENLQKLSKGEILGENSLTGLFTVELEKDEQIRRRIQELNQTLESSTRVYCLETEYGKTLAQKKSLETQVNELRLSFLNLPKNQRQALLAIQREASAQQETLNKAKQDKSKAEEKIEDSEKAIRKAEKLSVSASSDILREIATHRAHLERVRKQVAEKSSEIAARLKSISDGARKRTEDLSQASTVLSQTDASIKEIAQTYEVIVEKWRLLVEQVVARSSKKISNDIEIPKIPLEILAKATETGHIPEVKAYKDSYSQAESEFKSLQEAILNLQTLDRGFKYRELVLTGQIRSQLLRMLENRDHKDPFKFSDQYIDDVSREFRLIPYRPRVLLTMVFSALKGHANSGISGGIELIRELFTVAVFFAIPLLAFFLIRRILRWVDKNRSTLVRQRISRPTLRLLTWIRRLQPYLPWFMMLVAMKTSGLVIEGSQLDWLAEILPYFYYYLIYKMFRTFVGHLLISMNAYGRDRASEMLKKRIAFTSKVLGLYLLFSAFLLETTAAIARRALFYRLVLDSLYLVSPLIVAWFSYYWREEIKTALKESIRPEFYERIGRLLEGPSAILFSLPAAVFLTIVMLFERVKEELLEVDTIKSLSAQLFRKKLESNASEGQEAPKSEISQQYLELFSAGPIRSEDEIVEHRGVKAQELYQVIKSWSEGKTEERTVALYGEKGIGKSSLISHVSNKLTKDPLDIVSLEISEKMISHKDFREFLSRSLNIDIGGKADFSEALHAYDQSLTKKKVIFIDNAQNIFLAQRKGFEAFKLFILLITQKTDNIFWCATFNNHSWHYLNAVTKGSQYFRKVIKLEAWDDESIRKLIMNRHQKSGLSLEFNSVIFAVSSRASHETMDYIQDRFFELLWEQSKGNPRTALFLWISAIRPLWGNRIQVGLPLNLFGKVLEDLIEEELFVIASILRHENLTREQAQMTTCLPEGTVQHAVRIGAEKGFLERTESGVYRISSLWQPVVTRVLAGKNLIYG